MGKIKVIIAESFDVYRHGLKDIFSSNSAFHVAGYSNKLRNLIQLYQNHLDAVCIISSNLEGSNIHEIMDLLKKNNPDPNVIVLTYSTDVTHLNQSLKAGVKGYLTKNCSADELKSAVREVSRGEKAFGKTVSRMMADKYADQAKKQVANRKPLTKRESEILKLITEGYTSSEIAEMLYISPRTVETHRANLMNKLKIKNTASLVRYALEKKEIT
jgi:DNA-binding NarL/FixJ family response regulator